MLSCWSSVTSSVTFQLSGPLSTRSLLLVSGWAWGLPWSVLGFWRRLNIGKLLMLLCQLGPLWAWRSLVLSTNGGWDDYGSWYSVVIPSKFSLVNADVQLMSLEYHHFFAKLSLLWSSARAGSHMYLTFNPLCRVMTMVKSYKSSTPSLLWWSGPYIHARFLFPHGVHWGESPIHFFHGPSG